MKRILLALSLVTGTVFAASPWIWGPDIADNLASRGWRLFDGKQYISLTVDPTSGGGVDAPVGSIGVRDNAGFGEGWFKIGAANTAWTNFLTGASGWGLTGNGGTNATTNFLGTTDSTDLVFRTNATERFRITASGTLDTTLGVGLVHSDSSGLLSSSLLVNADVDAAAAIAGTKIAPNFGAQNIVTTGTGSVSGLTVTGLTDGLLRSTSGAISGGATVDLSTEVTGTLPLANGGTSKGLTANDGAIAYSDADSLELLAPGTAGFVLQTNGAAAPSWVDPSTFAPSTTLQDVYDNSANGRLLLSSTVGSLEIRDSSPSLTNIFAVTDAGGGQFFQVTPGQSSFFNNIYTSDSVLVDDALVLRDSVNFFGISLSAPTLAGDYAATLPAAQPAGNGYLLSSTTAGVWSWTDPTSLITLQNAYNNSANGDIQISTGKRIRILDTNPASSQPFVVADSAGTAYMAIDANESSFSTPITSTGIIQTTSQFVLRDGANFISLEAPSLSTTYGLTLPGDDGNPGQALTTNGTGTLSWSNPVSVVGSTASPIDVVLATGLTSGIISTTAFEQMVILVSSEAGTVTANPPIVSGTIVGQKLRLVGNSDTLFVSFEHEPAQNIILNGTWTAYAGSVLDLVWTGLAWLETSRNGI